MLPFPSRQRPTTKRERVLLFGDDMRIFLAVARSLGRAGKEVHVVPFDSQAPALVSKYVHSLHLLPNYPTDPSGWQTALLELLQAQSFDLILPCCDRAILPLHVHRAVFGNYRIAIPNMLAMEYLFDKHRTRRLCAELDISVSKGDELRAADNADDLIRCYGLPLVLKPKRSYWIDQFETRGQAEIVCTKQSLESLLSRIKQPTEYIVEKYFEGVGIGVSVLANQGRILHAFQHRRLREGRGGSSARISETVRRSLYEACAKIAGHIKLTGICMFEFRYNTHTDEWVLLETNARFWGTVPLAISLGADFPLFLYDLLVHGRKHESVQYAVGVIGRNLALDLRNLIGEVRHISEFGIVRFVYEICTFMLQPLAWITGRERSDTFVKDDLRPAFLELILSLKKVIRTRKPNSSCPERGDEIYNIHVHGESR